MPSAPRPATQSRQVQATVPQPTPWPTATDPPQPTHWQDVLIPEATNTLQATLLLVGALIVGCAIPFVFLEGAEAIDNPNPVTAAAAPAYLLTTGGFVLFAVLYGFLERRRALVPLLVAGGLGFLFATFIAKSVESGYGEFLGMLGILYFMIYGGVAAIVVAAIAAGIGYATHQERGAWAGAFAVVGAWIAAWSLAALYHLTTLEHQADLARAAHRDSPAAGILIALGVLALAALARRRLAD